MCPKDRGWHDFHPVQPPCSCLRVCCVCVSGMSPGGKLLPLRSHCNIHTTLFLHNASTTKSQHSATPLHGKAAELIQMQGIHTNTGLLLLPEVGLRSSSVSSAAPHTTGKDVCVSARVQGMKTACTHTHSFTRGDARHTSHKKKWLGKTQPVPADSSPTRSHGLHDAVTRLPSHAAVSHSSKDATCAPRTAHVSYGCTAFRQLFNGFKLNQPGCQHCAC